MLGAVKHVWRHWLVLSSVAIFQKENRNSSNFGSADPSRMSECGELISWQEVLGTCFGPLHKQADTFGKVSTSGQF